MRIMLIIFFLSGCGVTVSQNSIPPLEKLCAANGGVDRYYFHSADHVSLHGNVYCKNGASFYDLELVTK